MPKNPPDGLQRVSVRLAYQGLHRALKFLSDAFGFSERREKRLEGSNGSIIVTEVAIGDAYIMLGPAGSHGIQSPKKTLAPTESLMIYVDDVDAHFQRARDHGAEILSEPDDQYWGDRRYEAKDVEGHLWFFHQRVKDVPQSEIDAIEASFRNP